VSGAAGVRRLLGLWLLGAALLHDLALAQAPDPAAVLKRARRAQERFEQYRVSRLPATFGSGGRCDVRIGRFCYWYDEEDAALPKEPREIAAARDTLVAALARAAAALPADGWVAGQRVRYLVEGGRAGDAVTAAAECRSAEPGWCAALTGLALHAAGRFAAADSAFSASAAALPDEKRCERNDLTVLLAGELRDRYRREGCAGRDTLNERLWWLARPLYLTNGNDLRTEHFARLTMARIQARTRTAHGTSWGDDVREMMVRYGWPTAWARDRGSESSYGGGGGPRVLGHEPSPSYYFFPSAHALAAPAAASSDDWEPRAPLASTRYAPAYARPLAALAHQTAIFRRGDSSLVVAAYDVARDTLFAGGVSDAALVLLRDERTEPVIARPTDPAAPAARGILTASAPWRPAVIGVEVLSRDSTRAARARTGAGASADTAARVALSDILLLEPAGTPPATLDEALPHMRGSTRVRAGERVGLFWEVYGLSNSARSVTVSLAVTRASASWRRRGLEALRLARRPAPVRLRWESRADPARRVATGALTVGLAELGRGTHRIEIAVRTAAGDSASVAREVVVGR